MNSKSRLISSLFLAAALALPLSIFAPGLPDWAGNTADPSRDVTTIDARMGCVHRMGRIESSANGVCR